MNDIFECLANHVLNGVVHIWSEEIVAEDTAGLSNAVESVPLRGVAATREAMSGIEVNDKSADYGKRNGSETIDDGGIKCEEYCPRNPLVAGKERMKKVYYLEVK